MAKFLMLFPLISLLFRVYYCACLLLHYSAVLTTLLLLMILSLPSTTLHTTEVIRQTRGRVLSSFTTTRWCGCYVAQEVQVVWVQVVLVLLCLEETSTRSVVETQGRTHTKPPSSRIATLLQFKIGSQLH